LLESIKYSDRFPFNPSSIMCSFYCTSQWFLVPCK
jgi:hypothetical protein